MRQIVKPLIEILAAIPSVAYGFFALVVFAPLLQEEGGTILRAGTWLVLGPIVALLVVVLGDLLIDKLRSSRITNPKIAGAVIFPILGLIAFFLVNALAAKLGGIEINSGTNALNVSIILGIMALPTVVSVSEDALQAAGRELREGSYALGATRAETIIKTIIPASISGILAAVILGRDARNRRNHGGLDGLGQRRPHSRSVVQCSSAGAHPLPPRLPGDMGEADHVTGSSRFHVLFALAVCLLFSSFIMNLINEIIVRRSRKKLGK